MKNFLLLSATPKQNQKLNFCWKFPFNLAAESRTRINSVRSKLCGAAPKGLTFTEVCIFLSPLELILAKSPEKDLPAGRQGSGALAARHPIQRLAKRRFEIPCSLVFALPHKKNFRYNVDVSHLADCLF